MQWKISYYNEKVSDAILGLPDKLLARYLKMTDLMETHGGDIGYPHTSSLGSGLFELRLKAKEGIARVFYCQVVNKEIVMLHSFVKKDKKLRLKELRLARSRAKEVLDRDIT